MNNIYFISAILLSKIESQDYSGKEIIEVI